MKRTGGIFWLAALLAFVLVQPVQAQAGGSATDRTIWDGVYTDVQATRGQRAVQQNCNSCHSPTTEWANSLVSWSGRSISDLHSQLRNTMPMDSPGRLTREEYADIVAYILKLNKVPAGAHELPSDEAALKHISVTRRATR